MGKKLPVAQLGVKAVDAATLQIELAKPAAWFLLSLTSTGHAVPKWTREKFGKDWTLPKNIVVNGPYKLTKWVPDDYLVLEKNPSYYDAAKVQIEMINLYIVPSDSTALSMYENGELDQVAVPAQDLDRIRKDPVLSKQLTNVSKMNLNFYWFNTADKPFDNVLVRKAFAAAIDKKTIVNSITKGGEVPMSTATPPGCFGYVDPKDGIGIPFDPKQAAAYLAQAGYPNGKGLPAIRLGFGATEIHTNVAQAIQKMWKDNLGVTVELKAHEGGGYGTAAQKGEFSVYRWGWGMDYPDAHNIHAELFHSDVNAGKTLKSAAYDKLIDSAAVETDMKKRAEMYKQAEKIFIQDEAGAIPLYATAFNAVTKPYLDALIAPVFIKHFWLWSIKK
jgi:oligopeptide transport system substrate-binding protein